MSTEILGNLGRLLDCPVCLEKYADPRNLSCGHQFCLSCLVNIMANSELPLGKISCPTCRAVTTLRPGTAARELPRPVLMNQVQGLVKSVLTTPARDFKKGCDLCEDSSMDGGHFCYQCHKIMCDECLKRCHSAFPHHQTDPVSQSLFCRNHGDIVTAFCNDCKTCLCLKCTIYDHENHRIVDVKAKAKECRKKIRHIFNTDDDEGELSEKIEAEVKEKVDELQENRDKAISEIRAIIEQLKTSITKLEDVQKDVEEKTTMNIKAVKELEVDLAEVRACRASLVSYGQSLLKGVSDPELVMKEKALPDELPPLDSVRPPTLEIPDLERYHELQDDLSDIVDSCRMIYYSDNSTIDIVKKASAAGIKPNIARASSFRCAIKRQTKEKRGSQLYCQMCFEKETATKYCDPCHQHMCDTCFKDHYNY